MENNEGSIFKTNYLLVIYPLVILFHFWFFFDYNKGQIQYQQDSVLHNLRANIQVQIIEEKIVKLESSGNDDETITEEISKTKAENPHKTIIYGPYPFKNTQQPSSSNIFLQFYSKNSRVLDPKKFANYSTSKDPVEEFKYCLLTKSPNNDCFNKLAFPDQFNIKWPIIQEDLFLQNLKILDSHSSPDHTTVEILENNDVENCHISLKITSRNYRSQQKNYGGDLFNARLIPADEPKYDGTGGRNEEGHSMIIPGTIHDNLDGTYDVKFPKIFKGKYRIEIIFMRNSESLTTLFRAMNGVHKKCRIVKSILEIPETKETFISNLCGTFLPDLLPGGNLNRICNFTEEYGFGEEFYCEAREMDNACGKRIWNGDGDKKGSTRAYWYISDAVGDFELDRLYEIPIFEKVIKIENDDPCLPDSTDDLTEVFKKYKNIQGFWKDRTWYDRLYPKQRQTVPQFLTNKTFVFLGDSFTHLLDSQIQPIMRNYEEKMRSEYPEKYPAISDIDPKILEKYSNYNFLDLNEFYSENCGNIAHWGALQSKFYTTNTRRCIVTEGPPVNKNQCSGVMIFSSEVIKRMMQHQWFGDEHFIVMTHGPHFASWHPGVYYNRMISIRNQIVEYKKQEQIYLKQKGLDPTKTATFIYKTPNWVRGNFRNLYSVTSGFQMYRMREVAFKIFGNPYLEYEKMFPLKNSSSFYQDQLQYPVKIYDTFGPSFLAFDNLQTGNVHPHDHIANYIMEGVFDLLQYQEDRLNL